MTSDLRPLISEHPARILIVDDHAIVRYGMGVLLSDADDLELCGEAENITDGLKAIRDLNPDAAVIDIVLKDENGLDLIREIRNQESRIPNPKRHNSQTPSLPHSTHLPEAPRDFGATPPPRPLPILVMSMHNESTHAEKALRAGAQGYIMKENADEVLVEALRTILDGKLYVSGDINEKLLRTAIDGEENESGIESLTPREKEVFERIGKGLTTKDIAEQLDCSPRTIEVHRAKIKKKLDCDNAAQVVRQAVQWLEVNS